MCIFNVVNEQNLPYELAKKLFSYNAETGIMTWEKTLSCRAVRGSLAGKKPDGDGYLRVSVRRKRYGVHRIAWLIVHGEWPDGVIDHINHNRSDNRISNLRCVTNGENLQNRSGLCANNKSGFTGVSWDNTRNKWEACVAVKKRKHFLGYYDDINLARDAAINGRKKFHKFSQTGGTK